MSSRGEQLPCARAAVAKAVEAASVIFMITMGM